MADTGNDLDPGSLESYENRYELLEKLSAGGYGSVHRARHRELGRPVALKRLHANHLQETEQTLRFAQEARVTASLVHPNIVKVLDFGLSREGPWIAYEFLEGEMLEDVLARGTPGLGPTLQLVREITDALGAAHRAGVLHRDIKPANIMRIAGTGQHKLIDFGIARWSQSQEVKTQEGMLNGTPDSMAPEYIRGQEYTAGSDLYAVGVLFYQCVTGRVPFRGKTVTETLTLHLRQAPVPPGEHAVIPPAVERLILELLEKDPARRPSSASELLSRLDGLIEKVDELERGSASRGRTRVVSSPSKPRGLSGPRPSLAVLEDRLAPRRRRTVPIAVAVIFLTSLALYLFLGPGRLPSPAAPPATVTLEPRDRAARLEARPDLPAGTRYEILGEDGAPVAGREGLLEPVTRLPDLPGSVRWSIRYRGLDGRPVGDPVPLITGPNFRILSLQVFPSDRSAVIDVTFRGKPPLEVTLVTDAGPVTLPVQTVLETSTVLRARLAGLQPRRRYTLRLECPGSWGPARELSFSTIDTSASPEARWTMWTGIGREMMRPRDTLDLGGHDPRVLEFLRKMPIEPGSEHLEILLEVVDMFRDPGLADRVVESQGGLDGLFSHAPSDEQRWAWLGRLVSSRHPAALQRFAASPFPWKVEGIGGSAYETLCRGLLERPGPESARNLIRFVEAVGWVNGTTVATLVELDRVAARTAMEGWLVSKVGTTLECGACLGLALMGGTENLALLETRALAGSEAAVASLATAVPGAADVVRRLLGRRPLTHAMVVAVVRNRVREAIPRLEEKLRPMASTRALEDSMLGVQETVDAHVELSVRRDVETTCLFALGELGASSSSSFIMRFLQSPDPDYRQAAEWALGKLHHRPAVPHLVKILQDPERAPEWGPVLWALGEIADAAASSGIRACIANLRPRNSGISSQALAMAIRALALGPREPADAALLEELRRDSKLSGIVRSFLDPAPSGKSAPMVYFPQVMPFLQTGVLYRPEDSFEIHAVGEWKLDGDRHHRDAGRLLYVEGKEPLQLTAFVGDLRYEGLRRRIPYDPLDDRPRELVLYSHPEGPMQHILPPHIHSGQVRVTFDMPEGAGFQRLPRPE